MPTPRKKLRLVCVTVQAAVVVDDGEYLAPTKVNPVTVEAARIGELERILADGLADLELQINQPADEADKEAGAPA